MKKYFFTLCLLPVLLAAFASTTAKALTVIGDGSTLITYLTLGWDRNPEPDIAGYKVYYGRVSGDYTQLVTVTNPTARIGVRGSKTTYFAVTAYNTAGVESDLSAEVHWP